MNEWMIVAIASLALYIGAGIGYYQAQKGNDK